MLAVSAAVILPGKGSLMIAILSAVTFFFDDGDELQLLKNRYAGNAIKKSNEYLQNFISVKDIINI
jgi:hypothetical protein